MNRTNSQTEASDQTTGQDHGSPLPGLEQLSKDCRALIETASKAGEGIIIIQNSQDQEGMIVFANSEFAHITGYTQQELSRLSILDLVAPSELEIIMARYRRRQAHENVSSHYETNLIRRDNSLLSVEVGVGLTTYGGNVATIAFFRDITERKRIEAALKKSEATAQALLESASNGIIVESDGRIVLVNARAESMLGYRREELIGQAHDILLPEHLRQTHARHRAAYMANPRTRVMGQGLELRARHKDGTTFPVEIGLSFIETDDETLVMSTIVDITERTEMQQALRQHAAELEAHNAELDAFAHTVAHDLKSPMSILIGFAELLKSDYASLSDDELQQATEAMYQKGHKVINIIDALLLLASVRRMEEIELEPLPMDHILSEALERLARMIEQHQANINLPDAWPTALGHGPWIEEVWVNYVSNAIKYGGRPPQVTLGATEQPDGMVRFWVRDNGPGLSPHQQSQLFTKFERLGQANIEGHGLGLSIVRRIVEKLGGQVGVESEEEEGSTFYFTLPSASNQTEGGMKT